jgi:alcohol dehydrogenase
MRQLTFISPGKFEWWEVPAPELASDTDAIVAPLTIARCDLDLYLAIGHPNYPGPFAFGHETIAQVVDAGTKAGVTPGQKVIVPFQISCGVCAPCQRGWTNSCASVPFAAAFGLKPSSGTEFGGALSDFMRVPYANFMLVPLPEGIDPVAAASLSDNIADGWRAVGPFLADRPGASVLVLGGLAQSVGLYAAGCARALGAGRVVYLDDDAQRCARARQLGVEAEAFALDQGRLPQGQFDIVVEAAGHEKALGFAIQSCAANGVLTIVSIHFSATTSVPLTRAYMKGITIHTGRVNSRAAIPHVAACLAEGKLHAGHVTHRVLRADEAGDAMTDPGPKIVFTTERYTNSVK